MPWTVELHPEYEAELDELSRDQKVTILKWIGLLEFAGPELGRPKADTLNGSAYSNMKELRVPHGKEVWRIAFAFDPDRKAIVLYGGDKAGQNERRFYKDLIAVADRRFEDHLTKRRIRIEQENSNDNSTREDRIPPKGHAG